MSSAIALTVMCWLGLALPAVPHVAEAQQSGQVYRIAVVHPTIPVSELIALAREGRSAFSSELRRLGYVEGSNLIVERPSAEGRIERYADLAREVVQLKPALIVAYSAPLVRRFKAATTTIPIVGTSGDPVVGGIVTNLARPGGNITGLQFFAWR